MATFNVDDYIEVGDINDTEALQRSSLALVNANGGTLEFANREYTIGKQSFSAGSGYTSEYNVTINDCTDPVIVNGNGAVLKYAGGLRYGSFDDDTGDPIAPGSPYTGPGDTPLRMALLIVRCGTVTVSDFELDGNITNQIIGGQWGNTGRQLTHDGLFIGQCKHVTLRDIFSHHHGRDGFYVYADVFDGTEPEYPHYMYDCQGTFNGRQGLSLTGFNHFYASNCDFNDTGKNGVVSSSPASGVDIEPEGSPARIGRNAEFVNCRMKRNQQVGMVADTGDSADVIFRSCEFLGTDNYSVWPKKPRYKFYDCDFNGAIVNSYEDADATQACKYHNCTFRMEGSVYGNYHELANGDNVLFTKCLFQSDSTHQLPWTDGTASTTFNNCIFAQDGGSPTAYPRGTYTGTNFMIDPDETVSLVSATINGPLYYNGTNIGVDEAISGPVLQLNTYGKRT